jgi:hypothetical protein
VSDSSDRIARVDIQWVRSGDEDRFYIYHIPQPTLK